MAQVRVAVCDICGMQEAEKEYGVGWPQWSIFQGIVLNGVNSPMFCPKHTAMLAEFIDSKVIHDTN